MISLLTILLLAFQTHADPDLKNSSSGSWQSLPGSQRTASILGYAETHGYANNANITLKVVTENKSLQTALRTNRELTDKVVTYLKDKGIDGGIKVAQFSSTPNYGGGEKPKSYRVENFLKVSIRDEQKFEIVAGAVDSFAEVRYVGIEREQFPWGQMIRSDLLASAFDNALQRKKQYEDKFGVRLVLRGFSEEPVIERAHQNDANVAAAEETRSLSSGLSSAVFNPSAQDSPFGEAKYTAQVKVEYAVEPK